jgi:aryl-alcohol dehydrogenase-like predicted oxidoreductase
MSPSKAGFATAEGTTRFSRSHERERVVSSFYRNAHGLTVSSLGLGTYLGPPNDETDRAYLDAARAAVASGINFFDTAINYRHQRSERALGEALKDVPRDEFVICTKAGFLTPDAVPDFLTSADVVGRMHSMAPDFLADQIERSRANLGLDAIDVFYLHNPETQLAHVSRPEFDKRLRAAFTRLEQLVAEGQIRYYGTATWDGYRQPNQLNLARVASLAKEAGGTDHHFRFVQLPFNLGMVEAYTGRPESVLDVAAREGITVVASATLLEGRVLQHMPDAVAELLPELTTDAQRAIQFTRSTPGIAVALVGMSRAAHVHDNMGVSAVPPATIERYLRFFE